MVEIPGMTIEEKMARAAKETKAAEAASSLVQQELNAPGMTIEEMGRIRVAIIEDCIEAMVGGVLVTSKDVEGLPRDTIPKFEATFEPMWDLKGKIDR